MGFSQHVTRADNLHNARHRRGSRSRFKGVHYHKVSGKWQARCSFNGRNHSLGYFTDEADAARAYDRKVVELFAEFARVNFPEEWPPERRREIHAQYQRTTKS